MGIEGFHISERDSFIDEDIETLVKLGLNVVQAKAYLTLLRVGPEKAKEIARASRIARPDIYRTLAKLHELGLVEKIITNPVKFKAVPIAETLVILFRRRGAENEKIRTGAATLQQRYREVEKTALKNDGTQFVLIPKKEAVMVNARQLSEAAQKTLHLVVPAKKLLPLIANYSDMFQEVLDRKVSVKIVTEKTDNKNSLIKSISELNRSPHFELRMVLEPLVVQFGVFDSEKILLSTSAKEHFTEVPAIFSDNPDVIELANHYFETRWITGIATKTKPISKLETTV